MTHVCLSCRPGAPRRGIPWSRGHSRILGEGVRAAFPLTSASLGNARVTKQSTSFLCLVPSQKKKYIFFDECDYLETNPHRCCSESSKTTLVAGWVVTLFQVFPFTLWSLPVQLHSFIRLLTMYLPIACLGPETILGVGNSIATLTARAPVGFTSPTGEREYTST